jgi:predicted  nucleic acid-binding Zn-ribbon protein
VSGWRGEAPSFSIFRIEFILVLDPFAKKVQRTCLDCGYKYVISHGEATAHKESPTRINRAPFQLPVTEPSVGVDEHVAEDEFHEMGDVYDVMRRCPKCGSEHFSQRSVTKRHPADPGAVVEDED